jgi:predicted GIY-YIG superfamily endonuclease
VKHPCVYILASKRNGTLYVGVTSDVLRRTWAHKSSAAEGFTKEYRVLLLVQAGMTATERLENPNAIALPLMGAGI